MCGSLLPPGGRTMKQHSYSSAMSPDYHKHTINPNFGGIYGPKYDFLVFIACEKVLRWVISYIIYIYIFHLAAFWVEYLTLFKRTFLFKWFNIYLRITCCIFFSIFYFLIFPFLSGNFTNVQISECFTSKSIFQCLLGECF